MIPFYKPPELTYLEIQDLEKNIENILASGTLTDGQYCRALEEQVLRMYHVDYAFCAPNATVALDTLVKILNPKVIYSPAFTWRSLSRVFTGRQMMWLDINEETWLPRPLKESPKMNRQEIIIYNHTFGNVGRERWAHSEYWRVIYDAAQAFGAKIEDLGDATVFGFAATKPVTCGEGGMIVTNDMQLAAKLEQERHVLLRMSELNAALGLAYLRKYPETQEKRRIVWQYYGKHLPYPQQQVPNDHSLSVFGILVSEREKLIKKIERKMQTRAYYEPLERGLPVTDKVYSQILCIPSFAGCPYKEIVELLT